MPSNASEQLAAIAGRLRAQGQRGVVREMAGEMRGATRPLVKAADEAARERLPKSGGLNELVAGRHTTVSVFTANARTAGVRLKRSRKDAASYKTNRGFIDHLTFGEEPWKHQEIPAAAGWWDETLAERSPAMTPVLIRVMARIARRIG